MIERRTANYPDTVTVEIGERDGYYTADCRDLPGFFMYDANLAYLLKQLEPCLKMFYKGLYGISVVLVPNTNPEVFPLRYTSTPIQECA